MNKHAYFLDKAIKSSQRRGIRPWDPHLIPAAKGFDSSVVTPTYTDIVKT